MVKRAKAFLDNIGQKLSFNHHKTQILPQSPFTTASKLPTNLASIPKKT
jgi:hypothetical protein